MLASLPSGTAAKAAGGVTAPIIENNLKAWPATAGAGVPVKQAAAQPAVGAPSRDELESAVQTLNRFTEVAAQDLRFSIDEESGKTIVRVVDVATQAVLRQIPNAEALSISRSLDKMQGLLVREKA
jgi:flagellar protein FlaG